MKVYLSSLILILIIQVFSMEEKRIDFREMAKNKEEMEVYIRDT